MLSFLLPVVALGRRIGSVGTPVVVGGWSRTRRGMRSGSCTPCTEGRRTSQGVPGVSIVGCGQNVDPSARCMIISGRYLIIEQGHARSPGGSGKEGIPGNREPMSAFRGTQESSAGTQHKIGLFIFPQIFPGWRMAASNSKQMKRSN